MCAKALRAALFAAALLAGAAPAFALQQVHVTALSMSAERTHVRVGEPFRLTIHAHVSETVSHLDGITLPSDLADFSSEADERHYTQGAGGTDYVEILTLRPLREGRITIGPVTFDVFDSKAHKGLRYSSNSLTIVVGAMAPLDPWPAVREFLFAIFRAAVIAFIAIGVIVLAAIAIARRRRAEPLPVVRAEPALPPIAPAPDDRGATLERLRREHDRASAHAARAYLWRRAGAHEGATLSQVLSTNGALDARLRSALTAAERASFIEPDRVQTAIDELIERIEQLA